MAVRRTVLVPLSLLFAAAGAPACKPDPIDTSGDADTDADTDSDTDADSDADSDTDTDADTDADTDSDTDADTDTDPDPEQCNNDVDDDLDGSKDCSDSDCTVACTPTTVRIVTFSDWHGQLDPITVTLDSTTTPATTKSVGGAAVLSAYFDQERSTQPGALVITAGDAFGGTPPLSAFFDDEPAIDAMNLMGVDADTFGNHNFDNGLPYAQHLIDRATFPYVSSNLGSLSSNLSGVDAPYTLVDVGATRIALIGITNPDAPELTFPGNMGTLTVQDPATSAAAARTAAAAEGATVFVVMAHMGATGGSSTTPTGPLIDFAHSVTGFHVIVGDHTDFQTQQTINGQLVVENKSKGQSYARIDLVLTPATGIVSSATATFVEPVYQTNGPAGLQTLITPDADIETMLAPSRAGLSAVYDEPVATTTGIYERDGTKERTQEMPIGDLVCDAFRVHYGTQLCYINGGGVRAPIPSSYAPANTALRRPASGYASGPPYDVVIGDIYAVQPFGNTVVTRTVTGSQLWSMLEHGFSSLPARAGFFPQISGFRVVYDVEAPVGSRVVSVRLADGTAIANNGTTYTLATTNFLNAGGDGYTMLADGLGTTRELDALVMQDYVETLGTLTPVTDGRIAENGPPGPSGPGVQNVRVAGGGTMDIVAGGGTGVFTVTLTAPAPSTGTTVTFGSSATSAVTVPASVSIPSGSSSATFRVKAVGSSPQAGVTITATAPGGPGTATVNVVADGVPPVSGAVTINEVAIDPPSDDSATASVFEGDYNCDNVAPTTSEYKDEFVELVNSTSKAVKLDGVSLWDSAAVTAGTPSYTIPTNFDLGPGESVVILGGPIGTSGTAPWCAGATTTRIGDARVLSVPGSPGLSLNNGGDDLYVTDGPLDTDLLLDGVTWGSGLPAGQSQVLTPEVTGTSYINHAGMAGALALPYSATPGVYATGRKFADVSAP